MFYFVNSIILNNNLVYCFNIGWLFAYGALQKFFELNRAQQRQLNCIYICKLYLLINYQLLLLIVLNKM